MHKAITIFIAEDHEITRVGLKLTLNQVPDFKVVGEAQDGSSAVKQIIEHRPMVTLMDIGLPIMDGIQATCEIKSKAPELKVIMLTSHDSDQEIFAALGAGADGYSLKEIATEQLTMAIRTVAEGAAWLDAGIARRVLKSCVAGLPATATGHGAEVYALSQREIDVLRLVVEGKSNQEIAQSLILSIETIKTHMRHIMEKLEVSDRTQAAVKAMRQGLV